MPTWQWHHPEIIHSKLLILARASELVTKRCAWGSGNADARRADGESSFCTLDVSVTHGVLETFADYLGNTVMWMSRFVSDYIRFILANKTVLKIAPLQVYASRALFGPRNSLVGASLKKTNPNGYFQS